MAICLRLGVKRPRRTIATSREAWLGQRLATSCWIAIELAEAGLSSKPCRFGLEWQVIDPYSGSKHDPSRWWTSASFLHFGRKGILLRSSAWPASLWLPSLPLLLP